LAIAPATARSARSTASASAASRSTSCAVTDFQTVQMSHGQTRTDTEGSPGRTCPCPSVSVRGLIPLPLRGPRPSLESTVEAISSRIDPHSIP
jgi:hypothetical protein